MMIMCARALPEVMGYVQDASTVLGEYNMSTIAMISNDCNGQKTKHIAIRLNLIREQVKDIVIQLEHLSTKEMTSDILTKSLDPKPFAHLRKKLLGVIGIKAGVSLFKYSYTYHFTLTTSMHSRQTKSPLRGDMVAVDQVLD